MIFQLIRRTVHGSTADRLVAFRSTIFYYLEPRLAFGKKQVCWICVSSKLLTLGLSDADVLKPKCGRPLYDDF